MKKQPTALEDFAEIDEFTEEIWDEIFEEYQIKKIVLKVE